MKFHLSDILSITTGRMFSLRGMEGIYRILNFMTGDSLFTHQLPRALHYCGPAMREQFPALVGVAEPKEGASEKEIADWLAAMVTAHGDELDVRPLAPGVWESRDPVRELVDMVGPEKVIVVND
jgi:hypothetical protein